MADEIDAIGTPASIEVDDNYDAFLDFVDIQGWGDGLPMVPTTDDRLARFLAATRRSPDEVVATLPPSGAKATLQKIAVNACMAGCHPEYLDVVLAAVEAIGQDSFNLRGVQATTHPAAVLIVVSGPRATAIGMNGGPSAFGPGNRANATIGRAVRLVMANIGGGSAPGQDHSTQGSPAKYSYCIAEEDQRSPWPSLRVARGHDDHQSVVFAMAGEAPHNINDHGSDHAADLITTIANSMAAVGKNTLSAKGDLLLVLGPEHAQQLAGEGWSPEQLQHAIFEQAVVPRSAVGLGQRRYVDGFLNAAQLDASSESYRIVARPEDINIMVAGGHGRHSSWIPTFGSSRISASVVG